ncbi:MAG: ATP synthase F0 subunit B [Candidatus Pelagibacter sp. TMED273]|nr:MAG: ATP synthase F0 subunit B [Candidatus Pelagibacter sp. TMED273]|tara:strand:- start:1594 stop:2079 length:486 start_codon:yes stop_codon:yes gene_type:complete
MVEVHGGPLLWSVITFLLLLLVLSKVAWGPIISALESREKEIRDALNSAALAKEDAEKATSDYEKIKQEAHSEAQAILADAKTVKEKMISDAVSEAKKKADIETQNALQSINAEKEKAVNEIKTAAVDLSIKAASKLIEKNLDNNDNRKLVNDAIDKIGQA